MESLEEKECEISVLMAALEERKSLIDYDQSDLINKCEVIQNRYSDLQERFNTNHNKMKSLEDQLKNSTTSRGIPLFVNPNPSFDQNFEISHLKKQIIILESDKEYLTYTLIKKEAKVEHLHARINILNNSTTNLESFLKEKKELIRALNYKPFVSKK